MYNLQSVISNLESQLTEQGERSEFLGRLKDRLDRIQQEATQLDTAETQIKTQNPELSETDIQREHLPTGMQVGLTGTQLGPGGTEPPTEPLTTGTQPGPSETDWDTIDTKIATLPDDLHDVANHLQEKIRHRSPFAFLTSDQRRALLALIEDHTGPEVVRIVAQPPPLGMNLKTSKQALSRFKRDHMRYEINSCHEAQRAASEKSRLADEDAFDQCIASDHAFCRTTERQIQRRLFDATRDPSARYQEIRWLISSLALLRKQYSAGETSHQSPTSS